MKLLAVFTLNQSHRKIAIKPFDVRVINELSPVVTSITCSAWEDEENPLRTIEVVGGFEDTVAKLEAANR